MAVGVQVSGYVCAGLLLLALAATLFMSPGPKGRSDPNRAERRPSSPASAVLPLWLQFALLLKRLEQAGHIVRTRESADRRVVTLRSSPGIRPRAIAFFGPYSERMAEAMAAYSPQEIQHFENFLGTLRTTMDALLAHEYEGGGPTPPAP